MTSTVPCTSKMVDHQTWPMQTGRMPASYWCNIAMLYNSSQAWFIIAFCCLPCRPLQGLSHRAVRFSYVSEMRARSERRQAILQGIQLLKDKQLASVQQERAEARSGYQRRRAALQQEITARSQELVLAQKQLQDLEPVR